MRIGLYREREIPSDAWMAQQKGGPIGPPFVILIARIYLLRFRLCFRSRLPPLQNLLPWLSDLQILLPQQSLSVLQTPFAPTQRQTLSFGSQRPPQHAASLEQLFPLLRHPQVPLSRSRRRW